MSKASLSLPHTPALGHEDLCPALDLPSSSSYTLGKGLDTTLKKGR